MGGHWRIYAIWLAIGPNGFTAHRVPLPGGPEMLSILVPDFPGNVDAGWESSRSLYDRRGFGTYCLRNWILYAAILVDPRNLNFTAPYQPTMTHIGCARAMSLMQVFDC